MISSASVREKLLAWYNLNKRPLPWRETSDPYAVWLSEIMLQQTTVETVIPYYKKFLSHFPTLTSVADASIDELLFLWQGLGYYNRIKQFHRAAQQVMREYNGVIPKTKEELTRLPGLGNYTAGAVASIAFSQPVAAVDGNIIRVLSRLFHFTEDAFTTQAKKYFEEKASSLVDPVRPGDFNQALMDLGSSVCIPSKPSCPICPLKTLCLAYTEGKPEALPVKTKKITYRKEKWFCFLYAKDQKFWLRRRENKEIMEGLWEFPMTHQNNTSQKVQGEPAAQRAKSLKPVTHAIMNRRMTVYPFLMDGKKPDDPRNGKWISQEQLLKLPLTTITRKILRQCNHLPNNK